MKKVPSTIVTESGLKSALQDGYAIEVVCLETPELRANNWHGPWMVRAVSEDGTVERILVSERKKKSRETEERIFKTVVGIVSFVRSFGITGVCIPMEAGGRMLQPLPPKD